MFHSGQGLRPPARTRLDFQDTLALNLECMLGSGAEEAIGPTLWLKLRIGHFKLSICQFCTCNRTCTLTSIEGDRGCTCKSENQAFQFVGRSSKPKSGMHFFRQTASVPFCLKAIESSSADGLVENHSELDAAVTACAWRFNGFIECKDCTFLPDISDLKGIRYKSLSTTLVIPVTSTRVSVDYRYSKLKSQTCLGYRIWAACHDPQMPFSFQFSMLYSARFRLIWLVQPSVFSEACLTPAGCPVSSQVHIHCESTAHAHRPQFRFNFKTVLVSTCSLGLSSISKRPTSMSTHVLQPLDLPNVYLQKVGCSKQEEHFTLALSDDAVDTPFLKKDQDQVFFRGWRTSWH